MEESYSRKTDDDYCSRHVTPSRQKATNHYSLVVPSSGLLNSNVILTTKIIRYEKAYFHQMKESYSRIMDDDYCSRHVVPSRQKATHHYSHIVPCRTLLITSVIPSSETIGYEKAHFIQWSIHILEKWTTTIVLYM